MISPDTDGSTPWEGSMFFECFNDAEHFFVNRWVIELCLIELLREESNNTLFLCHDSAELQFAGIGTDIKHFVGIRVNKEDVFSDRSFDSVETVD